MRQPPVILRRDDLLCCDMLRQAGKMLLRQVDQLVGEKLLLALPVPFPQAIRADGIDGHAVAARRGEGGRMAIRKIDEIAVGAAVVHAAAQLFHRPVEIVAAVVIAQALLLKSRGIEIHAQVQHENRLHRPEVPQDPAVIPVEIFLPHQFGKKVPRAAAAHDHVGPDLPPVLQTDADGAAGFHQDLLRNGAGKEPTVMLQDVSAQRLRQLLTAADDVAVGGIIQLSLFLRRDALVEGRLGVDKGQGEALHLIGIRAEIRQNAVEDQPQFLIGEELFGKAAAGHVLVGFDRKEGAEQPQLIDQPFLLPRQEADLHERVIKAIIFPDALLLGGKELFQASFPPVGALVFLRGNEIKVRRAQAAVVPHRLQMDPKGGEKAADRFILP